MGETNDTDPALPRAKRDFAPKSVPPSRDSGLNCSAPVGGTLAAPSAATTIVAEPFPDFHPFSEGRVDQAIVRSYLDNGWVNRITQLAATMAPRRETSEPSQLVANAASLQAAAEELIHNLRTGWAGEMNLQTLLEVAKQLGVPIDPLKPGPVASLLRDRVAGPVLSRLMEILNLRRKDPEVELATAFEQWEIEINLAQQRAGRNRPKLPCTLEEALRFAVNAVDASRALLIRVFKDLLLVAPIPGQIGSNGAEENERIMGDVIDSCSREHCGDTKMTDKEAAERRGRLKELHSHLEQIREHRKFREDFKPGTKAPNALTLQAQKVFDEHWGTRRCVDRQSKLAWLCEHYHPFWNKHRDEYLDQMKTKDREAQEAQGKMRAGTDKRDRPKWINRTKAFAAVLTENGCPAGIVTPTAMEQFKENLPSRPDGKASDQRVVEKVATFMNALCGFTTMAYAPDLALNILRTLRELGAPRTDEERKIVRNATGETRKKSNAQYKASAYDGVSEATAITCLNILREVYDLKLHPVPSEDHSSTDPPPAAKKSPAKPRAAKRNAKVTVKESRANKKREVKPHWDELSETNATSVKMAE